MTGLSREQLDRLYTELDLILDWQASLGRPKAVPLYTALVMVLLKLRHNLPEDVCAQVFGCGTVTVRRYQEQHEPLIDAILDECATRVSAQARSQAVLVDGFIARSARADTIGLFSDKKHLSGQNVQAVATLTGRVVDVGHPYPGARRQQGVHRFRYRRPLGQPLPPDGPSAIGDMGYQGTGLTTPYKRPPGQGLTEVCRACNTTIHRTRAAVERAIAPRTGRSSTTDYRRFLHDFPRVLRTCHEAEDLSVGLLVRQPPFEILLVERGGREAATA
ncbi:transposase family protein [Micromonospora sonneratiae]|uniref:Transposase family protein n=1 Tax=Micromonospora sonneratiae TaxID=1184706 RepID=A0ABW3YJH9_9ACTN